MKQDNRAFDNLLKFIIKIRSIYNCMIYIYLDFYNKNSMMCTSELFDPSSESDFKERSIQVRNQSMVLLVHQNNKIRIHLSIVIPTIFQHHVTFRNLSEGKGTVRLNSGYHRCFATLTSLLLFLLIYFALFKWVRRGGLHSPCTYNKCCKIIAKYPTPRIALFVGWLVGHKISAASYTHAA